MHFSQRLDRFGAEVFSALNARRLELEAEGRTIYNLSVGTPDFEPYPHVVEALRDAAADPAMWKYSLGDLPELKQAVCDYYARRFGVEGITPEHGRELQRHPRRASGIWGSSCSTPATRRSCPIPATPCSRRASRSPAASSPTTRSRPSTASCPTSLGSTRPWPTAPAT